MPKFKVNVNGPAIKKIAKATKTLPKTLKVRKFRVPKGI